MEPRLFDSLEYVKNLKIDASKLLINGKNDEEWSHHQCYYNEWSVSNKERICSVNGSLVITFEENEALSIKQFFNEMFAELTPENEAKFGKNVKFIRVPLQMATLDYHSAQPGNFRHTWEDSKNVFRISLPIIQTRPDHFEVLAHFTPKMVIT